MCPSRWRAEFSFWGSQKLSAPIGGALNIGALVGRVTLFGVTTCNAIFRLSHYERLVQKAGQGRLEKGLGTVICRASERLVPILMTVMDASLGLLPFALRRHARGREREGLIAVVILSGLVLSTAQSRLILPTVALRWTKSKA